MAFIAVKKSTKAVHLVDFGKIVLLHTQGWEAHKLPVVQLDDASFANLVTAYGAVVGT